MAFSRSVKLLWATGLLPWLWSEVAAAVGGASGNETTPPSPAVAAESPSPKKNLKFTVHVQCIRFSVSCAIQNSSVCPN